ncbi:BACK domain-containing protein [Chloropicon primus]|uniref:BACK domain-containing protein n=1 Tax=Chloropicon primus TaxID=1764295 RepID=A0A5B8MHA6_9CHLO|nr:hypothetical protein A3770_02p12580 [Chloropicon primus]UPQ97947.1 BACK domain-containing protein [Chloropicon primus]|eukprot:QDZ18740.1 hypothetical protein A3770_02p12580 [Chloropicon primus]
MERVRGRSGLAVRGDTLVVPPFEAGWLKLGRRSCCLHFEAKSTNDITLILDTSSSPGGKRFGVQRPNSSTYTVIIGSHGNSRLIIERNAKIVVATSHVHKQGEDFSQYWVDYNAGKITVGSGRRGSGCLVSWQDETPHDIESIGLSSWDKHVLYRNVSLSNPVDDDSFSSKARRRSSASGAELMPGEVASLQALSCEKLADSLRVSNCLRTLAVAEDFNKKALVNVVLEFVSMNFVGVVQRHEEIFSLSERDLADILDRDVLNSISEIWIFDVLMLWWGKQAASRDPKTLQNLFQFVRFPLMDAKDLGRIVEMDIFKQSACLRSLIEEARESHSHGDSTSKKGSFRIISGRDIEIVDDGHMARRRLQPRRSPHLKELLYTHDGDEGGVCFFLGTLQGVPVALTNSVSLSASSPHSRFSNPKAVLSRVSLPTSYFEPQYHPETGRKESWWEINLHRNLSCNHYSLRHDASPDGFLRTWELRGSADGKTWTTLRTHTNDTTIQKAYQYASWPIFADEDFKIFRIVLTGPNASKMNPYRLYISWFELYGYLEV